MSNEITRRRTTLTRARELRSTATDAERRLWEVLRRKGVSGTKFRRQQPYGPFILDFYCHQAKLVVELDGGHHFDTAQAELDRQRSQFLEERGLRVVRFTNIEVSTNLDGVVDTIRRFVEGDPSP